MLPIPISKMNTKLTLLLSAGLLIASAGYAQQSSPDTGKNKLVVAKEDLRDDWAALSHYARENREVGDPKPGENRNTGHNRF